MKWQKELQLKRALLICLFILSAGWFVFGNVLSVKACPAGQTAIGQNPDGSEICGASQGTYQSGAKAVEKDGSVNALTSPGNYFTKEFWVALFTSILLYVAQLGIKITLFLFTFIIQISAYNGYLDATAVNVGWVMVRDITNMIFVVALLLIAFGTILGLEQYEWKKMLVKFVMAAVLVNFSRLICGLLIDISQLVMTTFINGIVATAGGNLINAFGLQKIINLNSAAKPDELTSPGIFSAAVMAVIFSLATLYTIGIFVFMLAKRLVTLWILIVLSPMAFVLTVIPSTEGAASKWWSELMDNLVTGPVILFFIWLSFVTVGQGQINSEISSSAAEQIGQQYVIREGFPTEADKYGGQQTAGVGDAMGWNQMASFIVAIGMLIAGAQVASEIGGSSGSALTGVTDFAKKVGTIASGYAVGRYLYGKVGEGVSAVGGGLKAAGKFAALDILPVRHYGQIIANKAKQEWAGYQAQAALTMKEVKDANGEVIGWENVAGQKQFWGNLLRGNVGGAFASRTYKRLLAQTESKKTLEKTEHERDTRLAILDKSVKGVPKSWFQEDWERGNDGFDRRQDAFLDGMGERSSAKTEEHAAKAKAAMMNMARVQYDPDDGKWKTKEGTYGSEIAGHQIRAGAYNAALQRVQANAKLQVMLEDKNRTDKYAGQIQRLLNQQALDTKAKERDEAKFKTQESKISNQALGTAKALLAERAEAEAEAHTEHNKEAEILKAAEVAFQKTVKGAHELETDAAIARRMKRMEEESNVEKQKAEGVAAVTQAASIAATQLAQIKAAAEQERVKRIEETLRGGVLAGPEGAAAQKELEQQRILSATASELAKEQEALQKQAATQAMAKTLAAKEAAALRTARTAADQKLLEEQARTKAREQEKTTLRETEKAKLRAAEQTTLQQQRESEAKSEATKALKDVLERTNIAEQAKKVAEEDLKTFKDNVLSAQIKEAADKSQKIQTDIERQKALIEENKRIGKEARALEGDSFEERMNKAAIRATAALNIQNALRAIPKLEQEKVEFLKNNDFARAIHFGRLSKVASQETTAQTGRLTEQYATSDKAREVARRAAEAGLYASTGEDAMKRIDNQELDKLASAKIKAMRDAIRNGTLDELRRMDPVIQALINKEDVPDVEQNAKTTLATLRSRVKGQYIDMKTRGSTTPPTERLAVFEQKSKEYKQKDEAGRGKMLMDSVMFLTNARKKMAAGEEVDTRVLNEAVGVLMAASDDGNVDDGLSSIGDRLTKLHQYETDEDFRKTEAGRAVESDLAGLQALREVAKELDLVDLQVDHGKVVEDAEAMASSAFNELKSMGALHGLTDEDLAAQKQRLFEEAVELINERGLEAKHYSYIDNNSSDASRKLQSYVLTGGDMDYVRIENRVLEIMDETGKSWEESINEFYNRAESNVEAELAILKKTNGLGNADDFRERFDRHEEIYQNIAEKTKSRSLEIGHWQLVNYAPDENDRFRALSKKEHQAVVAGSATKMKSQQMNPQSFGKYKNTTGRIERLERAKLRLIKAVQAKDQAAAGVGLDIRARRSLLDLLKGENGQKTVSGAAVLSGTEDYIREAGNGDYVTGLVDRVAKVHAALATDGNAALQINLEYNVASRQEAEAGIFKATIAGLKEWMSVTDETDKDYDTRKALAVALNTTVEKLAEKAETQNMHEYSNMLAAILQTQRATALKRINDKIANIKKTAAFKNKDEMQIALARKLEEQRQELQDLSSDIIVKQLQKTAEAAKSRISSYTGVELEEETETSMGAAS